MKMEQKVIATCMTVFLLGSIVVLSRKAAIYTMTGGNENEKIVVIDVGHGGNDPGKVGVNQILEKDVNLAIALKLQKVLKQSDLTVVMTRTTDCGLYDENATNKKAQDMHRRIQFMEDRHADLVVSIHQNSFQDSAVCGPQCFYYANSESGHQVASIMQNTLNQGLEIEAPRQEKANDSYYILKKSAMPTVIVECGFLSNPEDAKKLTDETYQEKLAFQIYLGIQKYFNGL